MMAGAWFVAGIGTDVGKSFVTAAMCHQARIAGRALGAIKPIASGVVEGDLFSDPAVLAVAQGLDLSPQEACARLAYATFVEATSPDTAAANAGAVIAWDGVLAFCRNAMAQSPALLIEGAGGLFSPLTTTHSNADLARELGLPVLLVAGTYLGAISHTIATLRAASAEGLPIAGLVVCGSVQPDAQTPELVLGSLRRLAAPWLPDRVVCVPRVVGQPAPLWHHAPNLLGLLGGLN